MILFEGNDRFAYRDPACYCHEGTYHLFFTVSEKKDGYMFNRIGHSRSKDLINWSELRFLTPMDLHLNYCSPGNVIAHKGEFILCFTSYPMPFPFAQQDCADETARVFMMRTKDFETFSEPELIRAKGDVPVGEMGRMIDPFLLPVQDGFRLFFKQNGVSFSHSSDLRIWEYMGHAEAGENACVIPWQDGYMLVHSPDNGIAFAFSHDLRNWTDYHYTELDQQNWPWAGERVTAGFVMEAPADAQHRYVLFFHGSRDIYPETHGNASLAAAFTDDLIHYAY